MLTRSGLLNHCAAAMYALRSTRAGLRMIWVRPSTGSGTAIHVLRSTRAALRMIWVWHSTGPGTHYYGTDDWIQLY